MTVRWHKEQALMLRRYRIELATHAFLGPDRRRMAWRSLAPVGTAAEVACHCARGIGTMRKHRPGVCEKVRCSCKAWKRHDLRRADLRLRALAQVVDE